MFSCSLSYLWWYRKLYVLGACIKVEINDAVKVDLDGLETCISGNPFDMVAKIQSSSGIRHYKNESSFDYTGKAI